MDEKWVDLQQSAASRRSGEQSGEDLYSLRGTHLVHYCSFFIAQTQKCVCDMYVRFGSS